MGQFFSAPPPNTLPENFFVFLQEAGLSQIFMTQYNQYDPSTDTIDFSKEIEALRPRFKSACAATKTSYRLMSLALQDFILKQLTHHVMKNVLSSPTKAIDIDFMELVKHPHTQEHVLPQYTETYITRFLGDWQANYDLSSSFLQREPKEPLKEHLYKRILHAINRKIDIELFIEKAIISFEPKKHQHQNLAPLEMEPLDFFIEDSASLVKHQTAHETDDKSHQASLQKTASSENTHLSLEGEPDEDGFYNIPLTPL